MKATLFALLACASSALAVEIQIDTINRYVVLRDGVFYSRYSSNPSNNSGETPFVDPYSDLVAFYTALGLNTDGTLKRAPLTDQDRYNYSVWGESFPNNEAAAQAYGFPNLAALLADPEWGGPYTDIEDLYNDWIAKDWTEAPPADMGSTLPATLADILSSPDKIQSFINNVGNIPEESLPSLTSQDGWTAEMANALLTSLAELPPLDPPGWGEPTPARTTASQDLLAKALDPESSLYANRGDIDFSNLDLGGFVAQGKDFSGTNLTGAQFNNASSAEFLMMATNYNATNFSGLDMTGFNPPHGYLMTLGSPPVYSYYGSSFTGTNFTNAQNLTADMFRYSQNLTGTILTGTGVTKAAIISAMMTTQGINLATAQAYTAGMIE